MTILQMNHSLKMHTWRYRKNEKKPRYRKVQGCSIGRHLFGTGALPIFKR